LELRVRILETQNATLAKELATQGEAYTHLLKSHMLSIRESEDQQKQLDRLQGLVTNLLKGKSPQGEILLFNEACREDELRRKRRDDTDDDPNAQKDREPTGPSTTGEPSTIQGESEPAGTSGVGGDGTGTAAGASNVGEKFTTE
jgi:hypothetical protein